MTDFPPIRGELGDEAYVPLERCGDKTFMAGRWWTCELPKGHDGDHGEVEKPDRCPRCDSDDPAVRLYSWVYECGERVPEPVCQHSWHNRAEEPVARSSGPGSRYRDFLTEHGVPEAGDAPVAEPVEDTGEFYMHDSGRWFARPPGMPEAAPLSRQHNVMWTPDTGYTVVPSLDYEVDGQRWHGWLTENVWRSADDPTIEIPFVEVSRG